MSQVKFKYLNINSLDKDYEIRVNTVGFQSLTPDSTYPPSGHPTGYFFNKERGRILDEYQFIFISKGEGRFFAEHYNNMPIKQGKLIMIFPKQWHTYYPLKGTGWDEYYIGFNGPTINTVISKMPIIQENQIFDIGLNEELEDLFRKAISNAQKEGKQQLIQQYLSGIVMHMIGLILSASFNHNDKKDIDNKIDTAKSIMMENIYKNIDLIQIAGELNMSYSYLRKTFKKATGYSPNQYFQEMKIKKAKELLFSTNVSIKEICFILGYNSPEYFTNLFKKQVGKTPTEYREYSKCKQ